MDEQCLDNDKMPFDYSLVDPALRALDDTPGQATQSNMRAGRALAPMILFQSLTYHQTDPYQYEAVQETNHQNDPYQDGTLQEPTYQCTQQNPLDEMMLDPVLRADVAEDRPLVHTPALTPSVPYYSFRNLSCLNQPPPTFSSSPSLKVLRSTMKDLE
jgi:hypothetical protein